MVHSPPTLEQHRGLKSAAWYGRLCRRLQSAVGWRDMGAVNYPRAEPGSGGHQDLVDRLTAYSAVLRSELAGLPEAALARRPTENEWSIKDVVGHLCDHAQFLHRRLYTMIKLEEPRLAAYDQE